MTTATLRRLLRLAAGLLLTFALIFSGSYVLIYLARWEWVRAQIAGLFFLACLIMLATALILRRLDSLPSRPAAGTPSPPSGAASAVDPALRFPWLDAPGSTHVFLPILLGFGALLTLLATGVERLVGALSGPATAERSPDSRPAAGWARALTAALAVSAAVLIVLAGVTLMTRPDATTPGVRTYRVAVEVNQQLFTPTESLTTVATLCRDRADVAGEGLTVRDTAGGLTLEVRPIPGKFDSARFEGCLQDLILDHRKVRIVERIDEPTT